MSTKYVTFKNDWKQDKNLASVMTSIMKQFLTVFVNR